MTTDLTPQGAAAVRLAATVVQLKAERDRARGIAVALEQQVAGDEFRALLLLFLSHTHIGVSNEDIDVEGRRFPAPAPLRAALAELMEADR